MSQLKLPPLSLYIHIPWCVQKCPYCDFNSHALKGGIPEQAYIAHLLDDLRQDLQWVQDRKLHSIFFGGGTPSLLSEEAIAKLLSGIEALIEFESDIEITLEANPGTLEYNKFEGFHQAGVNRISIGVQSFQQDKLKVLGRIHNCDEAKNAAKFAADSVPRFNLDLMHGLPNQSLEDAISDLEQALALNPDHLSWYQLTIEPNTLFHSRPPKLPKDETLWQIQEQGQTLIKEHGYSQYEISGYSKPDFQCRHNLNYWRFGDYLGIGCGAHGKITLADENKIIRTEKVKHPKGYMDLTKPYLNKKWCIEQDDLPFEYFMNKLRLVEPFDLSDFESYTGQSESLVNNAIENALRQNMLVQVKPRIYETTERGLLFYNDLVDLFL